MKGRRTLVRDGVALAVHDTGDGPAIIFQHGLGGNAAQVDQTFPPGLACRRMTLECRGHGGSEQGSAEAFGFAMFADDVLAAADAAGMDRFIAGGVSMGAAISMRLACRHPDRVAGLILVRPAWTFAAAPENLRPIAEVADLVQSLGRDGARVAFMASPTATRLAVEAPDNLASLVSYFDRPDIDRFARVLAGIALDGPGASAADAARIGVPALVVGNAIDALHPLDMAHATAAAIPGAAFVEVPPKARDTDAHFAAVHAAIAAFLAEKFDIRSVP